MSQTQEFPTKLLWIDLEMTGLQPASDVILELGLIITDFDFKSLATYESRVQQDQATVEARMDNNPWWQGASANRADFLAHLSEGKPLAQVESDVVALVREHFGTERAVLAGNSVYNDRLFIKQWMPELEQLLHYRMLDVTSFKLVMQGKYGQEYPKQEAHRAFGDIQESIAELTDYLAWFEGHKDGHA